jgi:hypothetical protein
LLFLFLDVVADKTVSVAVPVWMLQRVALAEFALVRCDKAIRFARDVSACKGCVVQLKFAAVFQFFWCWHFHGFISALIFLVLAN